MPKPAFSIIWIISEFSWGERRSRITTAPSINTAGDLFSQDFEPVSNDRQLRGRGREEGARIEEGNSGKD
jgi:hypothetical protein